jgi:tetrahydromethanopterin S-methyltransferase subunit G
MSQDADNKLLFSPHTLASNKRNDKGAQKNNQTNSSQKNSKEVGVYVALLYGLVHKVYICYLYACMFV